MALTVGKLPEVKVRVGKPRPLTRDDLKALPEQRATTSLSTPQKLRESHHMVARLCAMGVRNKAITQQTGYSDMRLVQLKASPAFQQLVARYKAMVDGEFIESADAYFDLAFGNMLAAERHIADHIAEADEMGELIPIKTALSISRDAADRFGYGKRQMNVNVNVDFAAKLEDAIRRSGKQIDLAPNGAYDSVSNGRVGERPGLASPPNSLGRLAPGASPSPPVQPAQGPLTRPRQADPAPLFRRRA